MCCQSQAATSHGLPAAAWRHNQSKVCCAAAHLMHADLTQCWVQSELHCCFLLLQQGRTCSRYVGVADGSCIMVRVCVVRNMVLIACMNSLQHLLMAQFYHVLLVFCKSILPTQLVYLINDTPGTMMTAACCCPVCMACPSALQL